MPVEGDLVDATAARAVVAAAEAALGRIDVVAHLVGGYAGGTALVDLDPDEVRSMLDQHVWTTFNVLQAAVPGMVERGFGRVVAVTSATAANPGPRAAAYAAAKSAEEALIRTLAREVASKGVTANLHRHPDPRRREGPRRAAQREDRVLDDPRGARRRDRVARLTSGGGRQRAAHRPRRAGLTLSRGGDAPGSIAATSPP